MNLEKYCSIVIKFWGKFITDRNKLLRFDGLYDMSYLIYIARPISDSFILNQEDG